MCVVYGGYAQPGIREMRLQLYSSWADTVCGLILKHVLAEGRANYAAASTHVQSDLGMQP